jgi:hypothetical protein
VWRCAAFLLTSFRRFPAWIIQYFIEDISDRCDKVEILLKSEISEFGPLRAFH